MPQRYIPQRYIRPVALHRLVVHQDVQSMEIERDFVALHNKQGSSHIDLSSATLSSSPTWLVLKKITLTTPQGSFSLAGLPADAVAALDAAIHEAHRRRQMSEALSGQVGQVDVSLSSWEALDARDAYLTSHDTQRWQSSLPPLSVPSADDADLIDRLPEEHQRRLRRLTTVSGDPRKAAAQRNTAFVARELQASRVFFDTVESNPLTDQQRQAIVHDEDNALVIAGAGTGKTSTVVGKVGYVLQKGWAGPEEILLLAFTTKAADEMRERTESKLGVAVRVRTFHGLGLEIIAQAQGKKPSVCPEASDASLKAQTIKTLIAASLAEDDFRQDLLAFQSSLRRAYRPAWEFKNQSEYTQYLLDVEPRALNGRLLKSYEECEIANWLVTHGVPFEYEDPFEVDTATTDFRQYRPDFRLPEHGLYIEHWGVDRNGEAAPFIDREKYRAKMQWARELHAAHGTKLIETYSWERQEGVLLGGLEAKLREHGVEFRPLSAERALAMLNEKGQVTPFVNLVGTFLSLFKSGGHTVAELGGRTDRCGDAARGTRFLRLFARLSAQYEALIHGRGEIDFDDMITRAREHVEGGTYRSAFRYLLVDEFQDISLGRARLIQALRDQVQGAKLFCVGDDWQSIYRFTGSDISLTTDFESHFGITRKTALDRTFRFHDRIAEFSSRFVQRNPSQLRKQLSAVTTSDQPGVVVYMREEKDEPLGTILADIAAEGDASVFVLSRYGFSAPDNLQTLQRRFPRLRIQAMTAHASKGLEADHVVINGLMGGKYGFPSEIADDPVLAMVLADSEAFAEERRLFYVALTRARKRVYLIADAANPSSFVREVLAEGGYEKVLVGSPAAASDVCPACQRGKVMKREGEFGVFYSCSNHPICSYKAAMCSRCGRGRMRDSDEGEALCEVCGFRARICPTCRLGVLVVRKSKRGGTVFWGCSNYGRGPAFCDHTERMGGN